MRSKNLRIKIINKITGINSNPIKEVENLCNLEKQEKLVEKVQDKREKINSKYDDSRTSSNSSSSQGSRSISSSPIKNLLINKIFFQN